LAAADAPAAVTAPAIQEGDGPDAFGIAGLIAGLLALILALLAVQRALRKPETPAEIKVETKVPAARS
jgi:hypothetical protein